MVSAAKYRYFDTIAPTCTRAVMHSRIAPNAGRMSARVTLWLAVPTNRTPGHLCHTPAVVFVTCFVPHAARDYIIFLLVHVAVTLARWKGWKVARIVSKTQHGFRVYLDVWVPSIELCVENSASFACARVILRVNQHSVNIYNLPHYTRLIRMLILLMYPYSRVPFSYFSRNPDIREAELSSSI